MQRRARAALRWVWCGLVLWGLLSAALVAAWVHTSNVWRHAKHQPQPSTWDDLVAKLNSMVDEDDRPCW